ncbi:flagellin [Bacillus thuringiensis Sbt003]|uniref:Flagellin n=2 Tax=Bacillus cereus group TaxID=86661 RepID=A0A9W5P3K7_BACCE|nr:Flagellin [Bacillus thuringiensis serovar pakistani str. T13001]EJR73308.1 hypothetical protein IK5_02232 [Bacillus cereus VD154]KIU71300.1 flagellin [Bacillus thuringiensis Sbt003]
MRIGTNVLSMNARQSLYENEKRMNVAMEHLATGKKLNNASDNPANVAIVTRMHARASGMRVAIRNNEDAISMLRTAEAALQTVMNILQRMRDLAVQSANGTNSNANRDLLNKELRLVWFHKQIKFRKWFLNYYNRKNSSAFFGTIPYKIKGKYI